MAQGKIALLACGSFSPPTPMHLRMFEIARDYMQAMGVHSVIGGIVSPVHDAYTKKDLVSSSHRCQMLKIALKSSDWIKMSDWEVNQEGWTRTRVSLQYHQNYLNSFLNGTRNDGQLASWLPDELVSRVWNNNMDEVDNIKNIELSNGNNGDIRNKNVRVQVKLLCGADLLESFATPGLWTTEDLETILGEHGLVVITRAGSNPEKFIYESDMLTRFRRNITIVTNWVPNEVSSTMIRRLLKRGESVKYLIDDAIIAYIKQNQLYDSLTNIMDNTKYLLPLNLACSSATLSPSPNDISMESPLADKSFPSDANFRNIYITLVDGPGNPDTSKSSQKRRLDSIIDIKDSSHDTNDFKAPNSYTVDRNRNDFASSPLPGKVVKVTTDSKGTHILPHKVSYIVPDLSIDLRHMSITEASPRSASPQTPKSPQRSYDEIIKFIFTEHGIQVISDKEAIV